MGADVLYSHSMAKRALSILMIMRDHIIADAVASDTFHARSLLQFQCRTSSGWLRQVNLPMLYAALEKPAKLHIAERSRPVLRGESCQMM